MGPSIQRCEIHHFRRRDRLPAGRSRKNSEVNSLPAKDLSSLPGSMQTVKARKPSLNKTEKQAREYQAPTREKRRTSQARESSFRDRRGGLAEKYHQKQNGGRRDRGSRRTASAMRASYMELATLGRNARLLPPAGQWIGLTVEEFTANAMHADAFVDLR